MATEQHLVPHHNDTLLLRTADKVGNRPDVPAAGVGEQELALGPPAVAELEPDKDTVADFQLQHVGPHRGNGRRGEPPPVPRPLPRMEGHRVAEHSLHGHTLELQPDIHRPVQGAVLQDSVPRLSHSQRELQRDLPLGPRRHNRRHQTRQHHRQPGDMECRRPHKLRDTLQQGAYHARCHQTLRQHPPEQRSAQACTQIRAHLPAEP